ncbi:MAG: hypothetical protein PUG00_00560 [Clostridiales bacterium]|nr:hypothetical protein [Clostridiales bacterium]
MDTYEKTTNTKSLRRRLTISILVVIITLCAVASATYAWYIYNTSRHTTDVRMAAGAGANLQISNSYSGEYGSAAVLESFKGQLEPVSTNKVTAGFQKATSFIVGQGGPADLLAAGFDDSEARDYYHTSMYLRTNGDDTDIYLADIGFEDSDEKVPISSAIRVGLVVHEPGQNMPVSSEYIFAISDKKNPEARYNTATGKEGYVLDGVKKDGTTVPFSPYTSDAYCIYDKNTGVVTLKKTSEKLCTITGDGHGKPGTPVQIEVYIWLEGCDEDCTVNLCGETLKKLAVSFAGIVQE